MNGAGDSAGYAEKRDTEDGAAPSQGDKNEGTGREKKKKKKKKKERDPQGKTTGEEEDTEKEGAVEAAAQELGAKE